ncbi:MAG: GIY-YIG nuclease family protein [Planctomycetota bacterium]|nr:GIY-YIG nuclease family protein [Planctomycetota bacterium]
MYLVRCADGSLYCGVSNDLAARVAAHNAGRGAKYTRPRRPVTLVWSRRCGTKSNACRQEYRIKQLTRAEKQALAGL